VTTDEALAVLRVTPPITPNALKVAFRRRASEEHPDHSKHPQAGARFIAVQTAFATLDGADGVVVGAPEEAKLEEDGTPLTELGRGLGPTINGRPCPTCHGSGYYQATEQAVCPDCRYYGAFGLGLAFRCWKCTGTGVFKRNGRSVGTCFSCNGKGWRQVPFSAICPTCHGTMRVPGKKIARYYRCTECKGTGEVVVLNPVLPKGLFVGCTKKEER
jgi:DnaJ-class molecular chaperone